MCAEGSRNFAEVRGRGQRRSQTEASLPARPAVTYLDDYLSLDGGGAAGAEAGVRPAATFGHCPSVPSVYNINNVADA